MMYTAAPLPLKGCEVNASTIVYSIFEKEREKEEKEEKKKKKGWSSNSYCLQDATGSGAR
jgi:hypothetical protein